VSRSLAIASVLCCAMSLTAFADYRSANGDVLTDPTRPGSWRASAGAGAPEMKYTLNYIINTDARRQAMINGTRVGEGDYVSGARVERIRQDAVTLRVNGQSRELRINSIKGFRKSP